MKSLIEKKVEEGSIIEIYPDGTLVNSVYYASDVEEHIEKYNNFLNQLFCLIDLSKENDVKNKEILRSFEAIFGNINKPKEEISEILIQKITQVIKDTYKLK